MVTHHNPKAPSLRRRGRSPRVLGAARPRPIFGKTRPFSARPEPGGYSAPPRLVLSPARPDHSPRGGSSARTRRRPAASYLRQDPTIFRASRARRVLGAARPRPIFGKTRPSSALERSSRSPRSPSPYSDPASQNEP